MIYQLKIKLKNVTKPPVWRRVLVPSNCTFGQLHLIIQEAMGWENCHLYQFGYKPYGSFKITEPNEWDFDFFINALTTRIEQYLNPAKPKMTYVYDFGDDWIHEVVLEKTLEPEDVKQTLPVCLQAKGACPPEDCGGVWGYEELKELATTNRSLDEDDVERLEWYGIDPADFDPISVNLKEINARLSSINPIPPRRREVNPQKLQERKAIITQLIEKWAADELRIPLAKDIMIDNCHNLIETIINSHYNISFGKAEIWAAAIIISTAEQYLSDELLETDASRENICKYFGLKLAGVLSRLTNINNVLYSSTLKDSDDNDFDDWADDDMRSDKNNEKEPPLFSKEDIEFIRRLFDPTTFF